MNKHKTLLFVLIIMLGISLFFYLNKHNEKETFMNIRLPPLIRGVINPYYRNGKKIYTTTVEKYSSLTNRHLKRLKLI